MIKAVYLYLSFFLYLSGGEVKKEREYRVEKRIDRVMDRIQGKWGKWKPMAPGRGCWGGRLVLWSAGWYGARMTDERTVAVDDIRKALRMGHYRAAFSSLRAMRRLLERVTIEAYEGVRPMRDLVAMSAALKTAAELFVAEKQLVGLGLDKEEDAHPLGPNGGLADDLTPRGYVTRSKSYKKGTGARGTPVDEYKVTEEAGGPDSRPLLEQAGAMEEEF